MALNYHEMLLLVETAFNSVKVSNKESYVLVWNTEENLGLDILESLTQK